MGDFVAPCQADIGRACLVWLVWSGLGLALVVDEEALLQDQTRRAEEMRRFLGSVYCSTMLKGLGASTVVILSNCM